MGRIGDLIPLLYDGEKNEHREYIEALEPEIAFLEQRIKEIPDLADVDRCPEKYLPYLAATTNCPLVGRDPKYWRRQIRNWPWLLKIKGREDSLIVFLNSIGVNDYTIRTWFRDAGGGYVEEKPVGDPFFNQVDGLWYNIRTHYFSVQINMSLDFISEHDYRWSEEEIREQLGPWFERAKPFHAELLSFTILPPPLEPHICRWDWCTWDHGVTNSYPWKIDLPEDGMFLLQADLGATKILPVSGVYSRGDRWDAEFWDTGQHRDIRDYIFSEMAVFASASWEDYSPKHKWHGNRSWKCGGTWRQSCDSLGGELLFTAIEEE